METLIRHLEGGPADDSVYREAAEWIKAGELVAFPTETVYGLGGNGLLAASASKIYAAKGRPSDNPLILHIADRKDLSGLVQEIPAGAEALMDAFWPGPLTLIFKKRKRVPRETTGGLDTVAIRMPAHPAALALIRAAGVPLAAPSANASGRPSPTKASHVYEDLKGRIPLILGGGDSPIGLESTIVDLSGAVPEILRPGYIGLPALQKVLGTVVLDPALLEMPGKDTRPRAPGMKYRHYAPLVPITLIEGEAKGRAAYIKRKAREAAEKKLRIAALVSQETLPFYQDYQGGHLLLLSLGERSRDESIAHALFGVLRRLDTLNLSHVYSETFETGPLGMAIMNRLRKAASFQQIQVDQEAEDE